MRTDDANALALTRAERGAAYLDKRMPGWWRNIKRMELDMSSGWYVKGEHCGCILAQLCGEYGAGAEHFGLKADSPTTVRLGFTVTAYPTRAPFRRLTAAWKKVIQARVTSDRDDVHG